MPHLPIKYQLAMIISGITAVILLILMFVVIPAIKQINELRQSISITHEQMEKRQNQAQKLHRSTKELGELKQYADEFADSAIMPGNELAVITTLEELANKYNIEQTLNVNLIEPEKQKQRFDEETEQAIETAPGSQDLYYQFYFLNQGKFVDQLGYLKALEKLPYYIIINSQQWEGKRGINSTSTLVNLRFDGIIYAKSF